MQAHAAAVDANLQANGMAAHAPPHAPPPAKRKKIVAKKSTSMQAHAGAVDANLQANGMAAPPAKKSTQVDAGALSRVKESDSHAFLKDEARARGTIKGYTTMHKGILLDRLREGSIAIHALAEWKYVEAVKKLMSDEEKENERRAQEKRYAAAKRYEEERARERAREEAQRREEIARARAGQAVMHVFKCALHPCPMAPTNQLIMRDGRPRRYSATCDNCQEHYATELTCERCDYDVCSECVRMSKLSPSEQRAAKAEKVRKKREAEEERRREEEEYERNQREELERETGISAQDAEVYARVPMERKRASGRGYTVWSSCGYRPDGWHSYDGPPSKKFDSSWPTIDEANKRARTLFFYKNTWGLGADEMIQQEVTVRRVQGTGGIKLQVMPDDSEEWIVSVCPDSHFATLREEERGSDYEERPTASYGLYRGVF